jgi:transposase
MTQDQALALLKRAVARHGTRNGCRMVAERLGITWETAYGWYRRSSVPQWRVEAMARLRPADLRAIQGE